MPFAHFSVGWFVFFLFTGILFFFGGLFFLKIATYNIHTEGNVKHKCTI